jgi:hypothetical protein
MTTLIGQTLIDAVLNQILSDVAEGDLTAIEELLRYVPEENLVSYLSEENLENYLSEGAA